MHIHSRCPAYERHASPRPKAKYVRIASIKVCGLMLPSSGPDNAPRNSPVAGRAGFYSFSTSRSFGIPTDKSTVPIRTGDFTCGRDGLPFTSGPLGTKTNDNSARFLSKDVAMARLALKVKCADLNSLCACPRTPALKSVIVPTKNGLSGFGIALAGNPRYSSQTTPGARSASTLFKIKKTDSVLPSVNFRNRSAKSLISIVIVTFSGPSSTGGQANESMLPEGDSGFETGMSWGNIP